MYINAKDVIEENLAMEDQQFFKELSELKQLIGEKDKLIDDLWLMKYRYDAILTDDVGMIIRFTTENVITFANLAFRNYFAILNVSIIGAHISEFVISQDLEQWLNVLSGINIDQPTACCKLRFNTKCNEFEWQEWHIRGIYGRSGDLVEFQAIGHEMPEYKLPRPFGQHAYSFRKLTEAMPVPVYIYEENKVVYVNSAFEETVGYNLNEIKGKDFWENVHPDYREFAKKRGIERLRGETVPDNCLVVLFFDMKIQRRWLQDDGRF
ncbi:MAG: PAS domain S-box protein [Bacillota bacterium]|nr:PAS domain S-box protein [Bacillota bacterium]